MTRGAEEAYDRWGLVHRRVCVSLSNSTYTTLSHIVAAIGGAAAAGGREVHFNVKSRNITCLRRARINQKEH